MAREIDRARRIPRANNNHIPFVVTFHPAMPNIGEILHRLHLV